MGAGDRRVPQSRHTCARRPASCARARRRARAGRDRREGRGRRARHATALVRPRSINGTATDINNTAGTINNTAGAIDTVAGGINDVAGTINRTATSINRTAGAGPGILGIARIIDNDAATIVRLLTETLGTARGIKSDSGDILADSTQIKDTAACIDTNANLGGPKPPRSDCQGIMP